VTSELIAHGWYPLAEEVARETATQLENIALMRHATGRVRELLKIGGSVEEYTALQPVGRPYDLHDPKFPPATLVVAIVFDRVYGVFGVGQEAETGTTHTLASEAHRRFDARFHYESRVARRFSLTRIDSRTNGQLVRGWEGARSYTAVQRRHGGFFTEIEVFLQGPERLNDWGAEEDPAVGAAPVTERQALVAARRGQGRFRQDVLVRWDWRCAVTGSDVGAALRASHCKPWGESTNSERLDPDNGLPLVATLDALFDRGLISFDDDGRVLVSPRLSSSQCVALGLESGARLRKRLLPAQCEYLRHHRENLFLVA
jgi:hypothetical protein